MKKLNYLILALIFMVGMTFEVKALEADAACITASGKQQCKLTENLVVSQKLLVQGDIELDLNGYTIMPTTEATDTTGLIMVLRDAKLTIDDTSEGKTGKIAGGDNFYAAVQLTMKGESAEGREATLIVNGGTLEGHDAAVTGNGTRHNTSITINGGTLISTAADGVGIYHPQVGTLVINGGSITGSSGIEIRSGSLVVNGGTITGTGEFSTTANGNGTTTKGVGIAIAQHTTKKDIDVQIKGGTITGVTALYESNPQNNATEYIDKINVSVTGGTFNATGDTAIYSQDKEDFIINGTFNKAVDTKYVSSIANVEESNGSFVIAPDNYNPVSGNTDEAKVIDEIIQTTYESTSYTAPIETYDINLSWDDLHWVFVYEGNANEPVRSVWLSKEAYEEYSANRPTLSSNEVNGSILDDVDNNNLTVTPELNIAVSNHSVFTVVAACSVEEKTGVTNYTNPAGLKIAVEGDEPTYAGTANTDLATNANVNLLVKPTASRFVNNDGVSAVVTGEVRFTFTKKTN